MPDRFTTASRREKAFLIVSSRSDSVLRLISALQVAQVVSKMQPSELEALLDSRRAQLVLIASALPLLSNELREALAEDERSVLRPLTEALTPAELMVCYRH
jgi:hypothetical protein